MPGIVQGPEGHVAIKTDKVPNVTKLIYRLYAQKLMVNGMLSH